MQIVYFADVRLPIERANGIQTVETTHALAHRGHRVTLVCRPDTETPARDVPFFYGLPDEPNLSIRPIVVRGPAPLRRLEYLAAALGWSLGRASADVLMTRDLGVASAILHVPRAQRPPLVYESHGFAPAVAREMGTLLGVGRGASATKQRRLRERERRVWRLSEGYVTITAGLMRELTETFGPRPSTAVVPDGARPCAAPIPTTDAASRPAVVGYAGHLYPWKGVDVLIEALAQVPQLHAVIVGGHPRESDLARLQDRARALGLLHRVEFTGQVSHVEATRRLEAADILVLPNRYSQISARYTSPLKLFEYLSLGRPIVASDLPALREILSHECTAHLVAPDDPAALAEGLAHVASNPSYAHALGQRARALAADFSWDKRAERLESLFTTLAVSRT